MLEKIPIYELPFPEQEKLALKIYRVKGKTIQRQDYPHDTALPHKHNYFEICVFIAGTGEHEIDFQNHQIQTPSIHLVQPGQVHLIRRGIDYEGYLFIFSREFYNLRFNGLEIIPGYPLTTRLENGPILNMSMDEFADFAIIISSIEKEFEKISAETEEIIISFLNIFFLRLRNRFVELIKVRNPENNSHLKLVNSFNQLVDKHFCQIHQVQEYAELLNESPVLLNRAVKSLTGKTAGELILERLVLEAKRLLIYSDLSNKEVAFKLNYEDPSYFARIFRMKTGTSPSGFRKMMHQQYKD